MKRQWNICVVSTVIVGIALIAQVASAAEWNQWRGPGRNGAAVDSPPLREALPEGGLKPVWKSEEIPSAWSGGWGSPVVAGGRVYLYTHTRAKTGEGEVPKRKFPWLPPDKRGHLTEEGYQEYERNRRDEDEMLAKFYGFAETIYCLDLATGKTIWKNERPSIYTRFLHSGTATVVGGRLFILAPGRVARCVDADSGENLWETKLSGEFRDEYMMSCFAVADGAAVVLAGHLAAFDTATGKLLWEGDKEATRGTHSSPVVWRSGARELIVCNVAGNRTICVDPRSGEQLWEVTSEANLSTPVIVGDMMVTLGNSRKKGLRAFRLSPGGAEPLWVYQRLADKGSSPVVVGDAVFAQGERRLAKVDLTTGKEAWSTLLNLSSPQYTSLVAADGKVIYAHAGLLMFAAEAEKYEPLIEAKFDESGLLADEATLRKLHGLDKLAGAEGGQQKAETLYQQKVANHSPVRCTTPAIADGRLIVRFANHLACYDLRRPTVVSQK